MIRAPRATYLAIGMAVAIVGWSANLQTAGKHPSPEGSTIPSLINACLITNNVNQLVRFYEPILGLKAQWSSEDYAEFHTGVGVLAIFSATAQEKYMPGSTQAA